jgi:hypothetical protein
LEGLDEPGSPDGDRQWAVDEAGSTRCRSADRESPALGRGVRQNYPTRTHVDISAETIERLVLAHPNVVGLKQTDGNLRLVTQVRRRLGPDFSIFFCGIEQLALPDLMLGSAGMITASGNIVPRQVADLYRAFRAGKFDEARRLDDALSGIFDAVVYAESSPAAALKYLLRRADRIPTNEHRLPSLPPSARDEQRLHAALAAATRCRHRAVLKIADVSLTLFAWKGLPATRYAAQSRVEAGSGVLGLLTLTTDDGLAGYAFLGSALFAADVDAAGLIRFIKPLVLGRDPLWRKRIIADCWTRSRMTSVRSIGAIDVALWETRGQDRGAADPRATRDVP